ncbi:MAG TPA: M15 family metallopeptidase [Kribbellaceae bacterium]
MIRATGVGLAVSGLLVAALIGMPARASSSGAPTASASDSPTGSPAESPAPSPTQTPTSTGPVSPPESRTQGETVSPSESATPTATTTSTEPAAAQSSVVLTLDAPSPQSQWEDRPVRLTGRLSNGASWSVSLWRLISTGWVRIGYVKANEGAFALTVRPPSPSTWTVKAVLGDEPTDPVQSELRRFTVMNRSITLDTPASAYMALSGVTMTGHVTPAQKSLGVILEFRYGTGWRGLKLGYTDAYGRFRIRVPDNFPYHWVVRARTVESPSTAIEYSGTGTFDVKAYLWPKVYAVTAADVPYTYRSGCPVGPSKLRRLVLTHWGLDHRLHRGELILRDGAVQDEIGVWNAAIVNRFLVRQMRRVDVYGGSDIKSMAADNTSAFNCRQVTGNPYALSPHSYGYAIDINTVENPYLAPNGVWYPSNGLSYRDRSVVRPGMLFTGSTPTKALAQRDYFWGARWNSPDYQHFQPR